MYIYIYIYIYNLTSVAKSFTTVVSVFKQNAPTCLMVPREASTVEGSEIKLSSKNTLISKSFKIR